MAGHYAAIIDELRQTAGRLALKHKDEKAKRAMKKKVKPEVVEPEQPEAPAEVDEDPAEEATEGAEEEQAENEEDGLTTVFRRATRHARVVAHRGHGQPREKGPPAPPPTVRAAAERIGMPPKGSMTLKPRILVPKR